MALRFDRWRGLWTSILVVAVAALRIGVAGVHAQDAAKNPATTDQNAASQENTGSI